MSNEELSQIFTRIADLLEIKGENRFKVLAYRRASESIRSYPDDVSSLSQEELVDIPGIGQALAEKIVEYSQTGQLKFLNKLEKEVPPTLIELLEVPGIGPKRINLFWKSLGVTTLDELEEAARSGKLINLPGMGEKSTARILAGIQALRLKKKRYPIHEAETIAQEWKERISQLEGVQYIEIAGSLRRMCPTIGDIDLVGSAESSLKVMDFFVSQPEVVEVLSQGDFKSSIRLINGVEVQLWLQPKEKFGSLLQFVTGSKNHNVRLRELANKQGLSLSERGFVTNDLKEIFCEEESKVYSTLGLAFIPPELREDRGEIEAAAKNNLPNLIQREDLVCDLHLHSEWSDGKNSLREMANAAMNSGLKLIAITDHSSSAPTSREEDKLAIEDISKRTQAIRELQDEMKDKLIILNGIEVEILLDGRLDFPDKVLEAFDLVIASIHLGLDQTPEQLTKRLLSAIQNPLVDMVGHPGGKGLFASGAQELDWQHIFAAANKYNTILEINSNPLHLFLDDIHARQAARSGVLLAINSDAHTTSNISQIKYGLGIGRRAWLTPENVLNASEPNKVLEWINNRKAKSAGR